MRKKIISLGELFLIVLSIFSFSYLVSPNAIRTVSAADFVPKGCCLETKEGAICQDIPFGQANLCKDSLIGTSCEATSQCQTGCCYSPDTGSCAMRSTQSQCVANGGNWSNDASCNIPQCQVGCCVMGDQVTLTNSRECTLLASKFDFEKNFFQISPGETCEQYTGLEKEGACLMDSGDFSGEKSCKYTTKKNCQGEFKEGYLCTSQELNTICQPSKQTTCVEGKDQVYFLDSCGNTANVYDSSKFNDRSYWEKPIDPIDSCKNEGVGCGNCNYLQGSICTKFEQGVTPKPSMGDYVCKNLNCGERKHGESWCVYDFNPFSGVAPVGSRNFVASCFEGQISLEGCADFNQEICAQSTDTSFGFTEAKCVINDWRSCINANDGDTYDEVQKKCEENPQCVMFNDFYGEENVKRSDGEFFAGFDPEKSNEEQGAIDDIGKGQNAVIPYCVPRFTPGFQFWNSNNQIVGSGGSGKQPSSANYGGSSDEASAICSLADFTCVSQMHRDNTLAGSTGSWQDHDLNWECNIDGEHKTIKGEDLPKLLAAMNERCRSLGTCGVSSNINGMVNDERPGFSVSRVHITKEGKTQENFDVSGYNLSAEYIDSIKRSTPTVTKLKDITSTSGGLSAEALDSAGTQGEVSGNVLDWNSLVGGISVGSGDKSFDNLMMGIGIASGLMSLGGFGALHEMIVQVGIKASFATTTTPGLAAGGYTLGTAAIGAVAGYQIGKLISKNKNWSPGKANTFNQFMAAMGATIGAGVGIGLTTGWGSAWGAAGAASTAAGGGVGGAWAGAGAFLATNPIGWVIMIAAAVYMIYTASLDKFEEQQYYILNYQCSGWQSPAGGNCEICNDDVRPCSEYRCKSLGSNCHYFVDNGEPGYCAGINEIWSAQIKPWNEILTKGNSYSSVQRNGFRIQGNLGSGVDPWKNLMFGITTDKPATCRIDNQHTKSYEEMAYEMFSPINSDSGKADGTHHQIELNAFAGKGSATTIGLVQGEENEFYIRCMNFAGQVNEAEFVVQARVSEGPDLTPANLNRFEPADGSYLKKGTNSTSMVLYLNEPAECRFDYEYDVPSGERFFEELREEMQCLTSKNSAYYGEWMCYANLENLTDGENNLYFRCKDQPDLEGKETENYKRQINHFSTNYKLNICTSGLEISLLNQNTFIEEPKFDLSVATSGCLGDAVCSFRIENFSESFIDFYNTGEKIHSQELSLPQGNYSIEVLCEDEARNVANKSFNFEVYFDDVAPQITRIFNSDKQLSIITDEPAECIYSTNSSLACGFNFGEENIGSLLNLHTISFNPSETYFIKCRDAKLNGPSECSTIVQPQTWDK